MSLKQIRSWVILAGVIGLSGCAKYEPLDYTPASEIPPGPGLFTGERGAFYPVGDKKPLPTDKLPPRGEN